MVHAANKKKYSSINHIAIAERASLEEVDKLSYSVIPSFSSGCGYVTEGHVPVGCRHVVLGNQTYEVLQPLSKLSHQSLKLFELILSICFQ